MCGVCSQSVSEVMCHFISEFCTHILLLTHCTIALTLLPLFTFIAIAVLEQTCELWRFSLCNFSSLFFLFLTAATHPVLLQYGAWHSDGCSCTVLQHTRCCCSTVHDSLMAVHAPYCNTPGAVAVWCMTVWWLFMRRTATHPVLLQYGAWQSDGCSCTVLQHTQCCCSTVHDSLMAVHAPVNCTAFYGSLIFVTISLL